MKKLFLLVIFLWVQQGLYSQSTIIHVAPAFNNATSGNRAPNGTSAHAYFRGATIAKASELLSGMPTTASIKSFGFTFNTGASTAVTGTLKVYLLNTSDSTYLKGTDWATISGSMTMVYNGNFTIPAGTTTVSSVDVNFATPFAYTGGGLYVAYDWYSAGPYATTAAIYQSNTLIAGGVTMANSSTVAPTTIGTSSPYRPVMRFGYNNPYTTDASVLQVYTLGKIPIPFGTPHAIQAYIKNQGSDTLFNLLSTLNVSGANTFSDTKTIDTIVPGTQKLVTYANFSPTSIGNNTITVTVPTDQNTSNNSLSKSSVTNLNTYSYAQGSTAAGGVGFNTATGDFVAKFTTNTQQGLNQVDVNFSAGGQPFQIGIWKMGLSGKPDSLLYTSTTYTSTAGAYTVLINPPIIIPAGSFYVGVRQTGTTNVSFSYQSEIPIRANSFYYASPSGDTTWNDFAPNNAFRFMIEPKFALATDVGVNAVTPPTGTNLLAGQTVNLKATIANYGLNSQSNVGVRYNVNGGTPIGPISSSVTLNQNDTTSVYFTGTNAFTPPTAGTYTLKFFTSLNGDLSNTNDTMTVVYNVLPAAITSFPYIQKFDSAAGWTLSGATNLWKYSNAHSANSGAIQDSAVYADFYSTSIGTNAMLKSPVLNISSLTNPRLKFHVAYRTKVSQDDSLQIWVSTNLGQSFVLGSPALYYKSKSSTPSLVTLGADTARFSPQDTLSWRIDNVDLTQFSGATSLMIAFKAISNNGNNCWIDNVTVYEANLPDLITVAATNTTVNSTSSGGIITSDGGSSVTARGVCYGTSNNPTISGLHTSNGTGIGFYASAISGLNPGTTYYIRSYATNVVGTAYGNEIQVTTLGQTLPVLTTDTITSITTNSAVSGGNITFDGNAAITARGVCWSTSSNPTILNSLTSDGTGTGSYSSALASLNPNTLYYVRAYATNLVGTAYGNERTFTTAQNTTIPVLTTSAITTINYTSAVSGGNISSDGGSSVTQRGVCYSTAPNPTISNSITSNGNGTGVFSSNLNSLSPATTYYVRAYATNSVGTAYGNELTFTTLTPAIPTLTTTNASSITIHTAISGGNITSQNGANVTARGVCWSTTQNPTIADQHTNDGSGTGTFNSNLSGLIHSTTYYVRAYATNSVGTAYGNEISFTSLVDAIDETSRDILKVYKSQDFLILESNGSIGNGTIQLFDLSGKLILKEVINSNQNSISLNICNLPKGVYLIKLITDSQNASLKVIIE